MEAIRPDERHFRHEVTLARFLAGVERGDWRLIKINWPWVLIAVSAAPRDGAPKEVVLRFNLENYPTADPTAAPWDVEQDTVLPDDLWPRGGKVEKAFNPGWKRDALYIPCDRKAIEGHEGWRNEHAAYVWDPSKDITHYLRLVHDLLHSSDYTGVQRQAQQSPA